jgi:hypothetical protein
MISHDGGVSPRVGRKDEEFFMVSSWALHRGDVGLPYQIYRRREAMVTLIFGVLTVSVVLVVLYRGFSAEGN